MTRRNSFEPSASKLCEPATRYVVVHSFVLCSTCLSLSIPGCGPGTSLHIPPRQPPLSATERQLTFGAELPLANEINGSKGATPTGNANYSRQANHCSLPVSFCSFTAAGRSSGVRVSARLNDDQRTSVFVDDKRHFRARGHAVAGHFRILGRHLALFEDRIARLVDRETGLDRRRSTGRGPHTLNFRDEPSQGVLLRRFPGCMRIGG